MPFYGHHRSTKTIAGRSSISQTEGTRLTGDDVRDNRQRKLSRGRKGLPEGQTRIDCLFYISAKGLRYRLYVSEALSL